MTPQSLTRIKSDIAWLIEDIGPRPAHSSQARLAALGIRDRLKLAGWEPQFVHTPNNLVVCNGTGRILLLAHSDTVPNSPGALDNAVAVASLIEVGRLHGDANLCLGFPSQEEIGLIGSRYLAEQIESWHPDPTQLDLVVSLDLVGHGDLSVTGLNRQWDHNKIDALLSNGSLYSEYGYQVVSRLFPSLERSDHAPFAKKGFLSIQLLGRNQYGITPHYHQSNDTVYEDEAIQELMDGLDTIIDKPIQRSTNGLLNSATFGTHIVPWWLIYGLTLVTLVQTIRSITRFGYCIRGTLLAIPIGLIIGGISSIPSILSIWNPDPMELEVASLIPIEPTGWWTGAALFLPIFVGLIYAVRWKKWCRGNSEATCGIVGLCCCMIDPVLAIPWLMGCLLSKLHPLIGLLGVAYWLQPNILRQLTVHGLLPPSMWGLLGVLGITGLLVQHSQPTDSRA